MRCCLPTVGCRVPIGWVSSIGGTRFCWGAFAGSAVEETFWLVEVLHRDPSYRVFFLYLSLVASLSRGPWTWPPWVIFAPAFNHKIGNAAHSRVSEVLRFTTSYKWKKQRRKKWTARRLLLETMRFWRSRTMRRFKMAARRMWAQQKLKLLDVAWQCPDYSLLFPCNISFAKSFITCLRNKAYVY